jgi:hypothetical protein
VASLPRSWAIYLHLCLDGHTIAGGLNR